MWDAVAKFEVLGEGRQSGAPRRCEANSFGRKLDQLNIRHTIAERKVKSIMQRNIVTDRETNRYCGRLPDSDHQQFGS
jgi:hypothetical protein